MNLVSPASGKALLVQTSGSQCGLPPATPENLGEMQVLGPSPGPQNQKLWGLLGAADIAALVR
jgi:hypothetical protein